MLSISELTLIVCLFISLCGYTQTFDYSYFNSTSSNLKIHLDESDEYFIGGNSELPFYQGKKNQGYIKFYKTTGIIAIFDFISEQDFFNNVRIIQRNAGFRFKFCTDYNGPIVYNYETSLGNKIRFSYSKPQISLEFTSKTNSFLDNNLDFLPVFVCISSDAYAFHTNLKCEGLANCDSRIAESNIKEAKNYDYEFCKICTSDQ